MFGSPETTTRRSSWFTPPKLGSTTRESPPSRPSDERCWPEWLEKPSKSPPPGVVPVHDRQRKSPGAADTRRRSIALNCASTNVRWLAHRHRRLQVSRVNDETRAGVEKTGSEPWAALIITSG